MSMELTASPSKNPVNFALPVLLGVSLLVLSGFTSAGVSTTTDQTAHCAKLATNTDNLPEKVLVGTDIADSASFEDSDADLAGQYLGELGGATVGAMIDTDSVVRQFKEPGADPHNQTFQPICIEGPYLYARGLVVRRVAEGVLWLQQESGVDGLPSDKWLLLKPLQ